MSLPLDQLKQQFHEQLKQFKHNQAQQFNPTDKSEFETLYWKLIPLLQVDLTRYGKSCRVYETTPDDEKLKVTSG